MVALDFPSTKGNSFEDNFVISSRSKQFQYYKDLEAIVIGLKIRMKTYFGRFSLRACHLGSGVTLVIEISDEAKEHYKIQIQSKFQQFQL